MVTRRLFKGKKALALVMALALTVANLGFTAVEATAATSVAAGEYNASVTATDINTGTYGVSQYFNGAIDYIVAVDGTATLDYALASGPSTGTFSKTYYDAGVIYYKFHEADEWKEVPEGDMAYGSQRPNAVTFQLPDTSVTEFYVKVDVHKRGSTLAAATYHSVSDGKLSFAISQTATPVITAVEPAFKDTTSVSIASATSGATIYYTVDGVEKEYTEAFEIDDTTTVTARATTNKYLDSEVATATFRKSEADGFGAYNTVYAEGEHTLKVSTKAAGKTTASSYADFVSEEATLIVDENNDAMLKVEFLYGVMNKGWDFLGYIEEIRYVDTEGNKIYAEVLEYFEEESVINAGTHPPKVVLIPIENKRGTLLELWGKSAFVSDNAIMPTYTSDHDFDLWIEDFMDDNYVEPEVEDTLPEVEDTGFLFGSTETELAPGKYVIDAKFMKANDHAEDSMSQDAVNGDIILEVKEDASATVSIEFIEMVYGGIASNVSAFRYYTSDTPNASYIKNATINTTNILGLPNDTTINITNKALDGIYTNFDVLYIHSNLDAYLTLNYETATPYVEPVYEVLTATGDTSYDASQGGTVTFKINGSYTEFKELRINGMLIPTTYYTVRDTSIATISLARYGTQSFEVILSEELLAMLKSGKNDIEVYTESGIATMSLEIENGNDEVVYKFGSQNTELAPGTYTIDAQFLKANDHGEVSMSDDAVEGDYILTVAEDGKATISMNFAPMDYSGFLASVSAVRYYTSAGVDAAYLVDATINTTDDDDMPNNVTMNITDNSLDGLYVNFDVLNIHSDLDAYLAFDYETATVYVDNGTSDDAQDTPQDTTVDTTADDTSDIPKTGDNTSVVLYLSLLMLSMMGMYAIKREENK